MSAVLTFGQIAGEPVEQAKPAGDGLITYIDISSIDRARKQITGFQRLPASHAPSRARQKLRPGDVLVSMTRPNLNAVALVLPEFSGAIGSTGFHVLRSQIADPRWLCYRVQAPDFIHAMCALVQGVLYPAVRPKDILAFETVCPSLEDQRRNADELDKQFTRLDNAVGALKRVQANLKRYRASVLKAACEGHLVPTEAELARKEGRTYETGAQLLQRILKERRAKWEADQLARMLAAGKPPKNDDWKKMYKQPPRPSMAGLRALPEGWAWASWEEIGFSQNGRAFPSSEYLPQGVPLLRPGNLHEGGRVEWAVENTRCLDEEWASRFPGFIIRGNELVMNLTAQSLKDEFLGRMCLTAPGERCLLNQRIARLTPVLASPRYVLCVFRSPVFRRFVNTLNTGSLIQHMFTSQLADFVMPLPPLAEQQRIVDAVGRALAGVQRIEREAQLQEERSQRLRQAILRDAFEGRLCRLDAGQVRASAERPSVRMAQTGA